MSDKNLVMLGFKYLQKKNGINEKYKVLEQAWIIEHMDCFHFSQITNKNAQFPFKNLQFSTFTMFSLHS